MKKYSLTMGLNDKDSKRQEISTPEAKKRLNKILLDHFGIYAYTVTECEGCYMHSNGEIVNEKSLNIIIVSDTSIDRKIYMIVRTLKRLYNQESIMVEIANVNVTF